MTGEFLIFADESISSHQSDHETPAVIDIAHAIEQFAKEREHHEHDHRHSNGCDEWILAHITERQDQRQDDRCSQTHAQRIRMVIGQQYRKQPLVIETLIKQMQRIIDADASVVQQDIEHRCYHDGRHA